MKHFIYLILALLTSLTTLSCSSEDEKPLAPLKLRTASIAEGDEVYADITTSLTLSFNVRVSVAQGAKASLNGSPATMSVSKNSVLDIVVDLALTEGTNYTLTVPAGAIVSKDDGKSASSDITIHFSTKKAIPQGNTFPDSDPATVTRVLGFGWNLGNHFDSYDGGNAASNYRITWNKSCPFWDGVNPTEDLYKNLAKAGVRTVRIPVTWGPYENMTNGTYTIEESYMQLVKKNVLWAKAAGLIVVLNTHHDEYWQDAYSAASDAKTNSNIKTRIEHTWRQIAESFKDEGDYLILESFNELNHNWARPTSGEMTIMNEWNQLVVNTIRATGGNNATRWIAVPSCHASPSYALDSKFKLPSDPAHRLIVAVHCYDPYSFTLEKENNSNNADLKVKSWGSATDQKAITQTLGKLKSQFIDKGIPCYLGEMGCSRHKTAKGNECRRFYFEYFCRAAYFAGLAPVLWDNHNPGGGAEHHAYFSHKDGAWMETDAEDLVKLMVKAATSTDAAYTLESIASHASK